MVKYSCKGEVKMNISQMIGNKINDLMEKSI